MSDKSKWEFDGYYYTINHGIVKSVVGSLCEWCLEVGLENYTLITKWEDCSNISNAKRSALREGKRANEALKKIS